MCRSQLNRPGSEPVIRVRQRVHECGGLWFNGAVATHPDCPAATRSLTRGVHRGGFSLTATCGVAVALAGLMATGCAATPVPLRAPRIPPLQTPVPTIIPVGEGAVVGGIDLCGGVIPKVHPQFEAGTVKVFRGSLTTEQASPPGSFQYVLPGVPVAQVKVRVNQEFRFFLPPGDYVLDVGAPWIPVEVAVRSGATSVNDIPGACL